jgi:hypothetical protein
VTLTEARRRHGLTTSEDWCAWLFEQGQDEPTSPADEAALVAVLAADPPDVDWEARYCMAVDESQVPQGFRDTPPGIPASGTLQQSSGQARVNANCRQ